MKAKCVLFILLVTGLRGIAETTNIVDIAALAACGTGSTNGWALVGIDSYADKPSVRLNAKTDRITSPNYGKTIKRLILHVKSSSTSGRRLMIFPYINSEYPTDSAISFDYSPKNDTYVPQEIVFPIAQPATSFRIALYDQDKTTTAWGFTNLTVITESQSQSPLKSPDKITIERLRSSSARICWNRNDSAKSWLVSISNIVMTPESFTVLTNYDFALCQQVKENDNTSKANDLHDKYPEFSGEKINYSSLTDGVLKVSTETSNGYLTHAGLATYTNIVIEISAMRYAGDTKCKSISVYYLDNNNLTNVVGTIDIDDEFATGRVSLVGMPDGTAINIGALDGERNRRFYIDQITFLKDYTPATVSTNVIRSTLVNDNHFTISGLSRRSDYLVTVTAIDDTGTQAPPSVPLSFTTPNHNHGSLIFLR